MRGWVNCGRLAMAVACGICLLPDGGASAGETEVRVEVEAIVPPLQRLEVDPSILVTPEIQAEDLAAGYAWLPQPLVLSVWSNVGWELSIRWANDDKSDGAVRTRDASLLEWSTRNASFRPLSGDWVTVLTDRAPAAAERVEVRLRVPIRPGEIKPGAYQLRLEYRLVPAES